MNLRQNDIFNEYVDSYKKLALKDKYSEVISLLKHDVVFLSKILSMNNNDSDILYNREILDINNANYTSDDFAEAVFVYTYAIRELLASYIEMKEDL